jgi:hypothetical protein
VPDPDIPSPRGGADARAASELLGRGSLSDGGRVELTKHPHPPSGHPLPRREGLNLILRSPLFWAVAPITCVTNAMGLAVQGLWAGPWLVDVVGMAPRDIGNYLLLISAGMLIANITLGTVMGRIVARGGSAVWFAAIACVGALLGLLPWLVSWKSQPALLLTLFGLTHVAGNLVFAALMPRFPAAVAGRLSTTLNFIMFGLGFVLQWGIGVIVNRYPAQTPGRYLPEGYEMAFLVVATIEGVVIVWTMFALLRLNKANTNVVQVSP